MADCPLTDRQIQSRAYIDSYIEGLLENDNEFTGKVELNFKDGRLMSLSQTKRVKVGEA